MRIVLSALYSDRYPASGETHALSALAGQLRRDCASSIERLELLDMVALGREAFNELTKVAAETRPDVIGLSVTYGTYSKLNNTVRQLREVVGKTCQFVFGGALATYLAEDIVREIDEGGVVFVGEAETSLVQLVRAGLKRSAFKSIPGISYLESGQFIQNARKLTPTNCLAPPDRTHLASLIPSEIQLYSEISRGCSWSHCTFCLRKLLDVEGLGTEYRRFPVERLTSDLSHLRALGATSVTFADEDFLGAGPLQLEGITAMLEQATDASGGGLMFDASATVHSVLELFLDGGQSHDNVGRLKKCGLRKIFLGVESGSATQLRRFAKGHSREDAEAAIRLLRRYDIVVEIGWIMFDPLCTLSEIQENLEFLQRCDAADATSYLFNEIRVQAGTSYERILATHARRTGVNLLAGELDRDTLSYPFRYADAGVAEIVERTREWATVLRPIHYPLKNLTRYGVSAEASAWLSEPRAILRDLRFGMGEVLSAEIERVKCGRTPMAEDPMMTLVANASGRLLQWAATLPDTAKQNELLLVLLHAAASVLGSTHHVSNSLLANRAWSPDKR